MKVAAISSHRDLCDEIVDPMTRDFTKDCSHNGSEIEEPNLARTEAIQRLQEDA